MISCTSLEVKGAVSTLKKMWYIATNISGKQKDLAHVLTIDYRANPMFYFAVCFSNMKKEGQGVQRSGAFYGLEWSPNLPDTTKMFVLLFSTQWQ